MVQSNRYDNNQRLVKACFSSGTVLFRGILEIIYIAAIIGINIIIFDMAKDIVGFLEDLYHVEISITYDAIVMAASVFVTVLPLLLIAVAYFIIYGKSRSESPSSQPRAGFVILNIFAILDLIVAILTAIAGIFMIIVLLTNSPESAVVRREYSVPGILIGCTLKLIVSIVYKLYIGSVLRTARSNELRSRGAKAYGIFSILRGLLLLVVAVASLMMVILRNEIRGEMIELVSDYNINEIILFLTEKGEWLYLMLFILSLSAFFVYLFDGIIALWFNRCIKDARYEGGYDDPQPPYEGEDLNRSNAPRRSRRDGYGDRFIED